MRLLAVLVRDPETERVVGGLTGRTSLGLLFVELFYLPPALRGSGVGGEMLRQAEQEAVNRGRRGYAWLALGWQASTALTLASSSVSVNGLSRRVTLGSSRPWEARMDWVEPDM
jgi:GNAT superfamily N-acetyltransferase